MRTRRTKAATAAFRAKLLEIVTTNQPMTVAAVHQRAVADQLVAANSYKTVSRVLADMRRDGVMPHEWIVYQPQLRPKAA